MTDNIEIQLEKENNWIVTHDMHVIATIKKITGFNISWNVGNECMAYDCRKPSLAEAIAYIRSKLACSTKI